MILHLLSDFLRNPESRDKFAVKPEEVLNRYQLTAEQRRVLRTGDVQQIAREIQREALRNLPRLQVNTMQIMAWGQASIHIDESAPHTTRVNRPTKVTVRGVNFHSDFKLAFKQGTDDMLYASDVEVLIGPDGASTISGTISLPKAGAYDVIVGDASSNYGSLSQALTVTV